MVECCAAMQKSVPRNLFCRKNPVLRTVPTPRWHTAAAYPRQCNHASGRAARRRGDRPVCGSSLRSPCLRRSAACRRGVLPDDPVPFSVSDLRHHAGPGRPPCPCPYCAEDRSQHGCSLPPSTHPGPMDSSTPQDIFCFFDMNPFPIYLFFSKKMRTPSGNVFFEMRTPSGNARR